MANETDEIYVALDALSEKVEEISTQIGTADDFTLAEQMMHQNEVLNEQFTSLAAASNSLLDANVDYSSGIDRLCMLLGYADALILLLLVFLVLALGVHVGTIVTNWLKTRG